MTHTPLIALAVLPALVVSARVSAQRQEGGRPDVSKAYLRIGPVWLNPTIVLTNLGVDTNVFNQPDSGTPKRDLTMTVTPQTDLWLRMGRSWVIANVKDDLVWYQTFATERSSNHSARVGGMVPLNRLTLNADADYLHARDRPGFEIDARTERSELGYHGSLAIRVRPKIFIGIRGDRRTTDFDSTATFDGVNLREALNRTVTSEGVTVRRQLTRLTSVSLDVGRSRDRFAFSPLRDTDSTSLTAGATFDPSAIIKGSATVGYRDFRPRSAGLPAYQGMTATVDLWDLTAVTTRLAVQAVRDVQYSFDINQPYYLLTGVSGAMTRRIVAAVDIEGRLGIQKLAYRDRIGETVEARNRIDYVHSYGGGFGYHLGKKVRIGFNVDQQHRASPLLQRDYHGLRFGTSVTYGR